MQLLSFYQKNFLFNFKLDWRRRLESNLRHQVAELGVSEKVKFLGILSQDKIANELNNSSLFVLPSMAEGRPKVVAEALATGLPCVVSGACSCDDIVKGAGISLKKVTSDTIFDAVMKIMNATQQTGKIYH